MAEYGVNIKASVQGQENVKKLAGEIKKITDGLEAADRAFSSFQSKLKSFDQRKREKEINEELDRRADIYTSMERMQRQLLANDNSRIKSLRKQADLEEHISRTISAGRMRRESRAALRLQGDPNAHASPIGPQRDLERESRLQLMRQTASQVEAFDAQKKFAVEMGRINERLDRKAHDMKVDMLLQEFKTEEAFQKATFEKMIALSKKELDENAKILGIKTDQEMAAIKKIDKERRRTARESLMLTGQTSPVGGAAGIPGSPAALAAAERSKRLRSAQSSALIGGAFPLLFGQGAGASIGGAAGGFGGGMIGGEFGFGLSLIGTQIGSLFDQLATKAVDLGKALNPLTADTDAIIQAVGKGETEFAALVSELNAAGRSAEALELATKELEIVVGQDGVEALETFSGRIVQLQNEFGILVTKVAALGAEFFNVLTGESPTIVSLRERMSAVATARQSDKPELQTEVAKLDALGADPKARIAQQEKILDLVRNGTKEERQKLKLSELTLKQGKDQARLVRESTEMTRLQGQLAASGVDSNSKQGALIRQRIADLTEEQAITKAYKDFATDVISKETLRATLVDIRANRELASAKIIADVDKASERSSEKTDKANERQQRAIERRVKAVDREIERTENAFNKASQQLDSITQKHEDKMAFEREYSRLIMEGSTPAAAKQAVELKKQLLELDRGYEKLLDTVNAQIIRTEASLEDLKNQKGVTNEYDEQLKKLDELKEKRDGLKDKKGKAAGAIEKDLAPKTFLDKLDDEAERLQGVLNALVDPANQVIAAANAIGDAFSESFRGVISGSMTAQEALANLFQRTADHFLDMTAQIIAAAIKAQAVQFVTQIIGSIASAGVSAGAAAPASKVGAAANLPGPTGDFGLGAGPSFGSVSDFKPATILPAAKFAQGGFVSSPTSALIGEGGEPEYVIPASKMRESMARYSRGSRGGGVIPANGGGSGGMQDGGGGAAVAAPIDVRYTVERINSVDYVTADQFQSGMRQAADQGAKQGEQQTLKRLQMSSGTRKRLGM